MSFFMLAIIFTLISPLMFSKFETELQACLTEIMGKYFKAKSMLVYDARIWGPRPRRILVNKSPEININALLRVVVGDIDRAIDVANAEHQTDANILNRKIRGKPKSSIFLLSGKTAENWELVSQVFRTVQKNEEWYQQGLTIILALSSRRSVNTDQMGTMMLGAHWRWNKAANVLAMVAEKDALYLYTWFPYRPPDCTRPWSLLKPLDIWENGTFLNNADLFPTKIKTDLEGCAFAVLSAECYPYTFHLDDDYGNQGPWTGFERALFETLASHFNFSVEEVNVPANESIFGTVNKIGTPEGAMGVLQRREADLAYSCLMVQQDRFNLADPLPTYFHDSLTWFIPTPDHKSHVSNVFEAFPQKYWFLIFITTVAAMSCYFLISRVDEYLLKSETPTGFVGATLRVFAMALSSPFTMSSKNLRLRAFTFMFAMYSLHVTTIYQASLYNLYRSNVLINVYHDFEECVDKNLFVWLRESNKDMYNEEEDDIWKRVKQPGHYAFISNIYDAATQTAEKKTSVFLFIKSSMLALIKLAYLDERRQPMIWYLDEQFASYPVTAYMSPGHPFANKMTLAIQNVMSAGLMNHWFAQTVVFEREAVSAYVSNVSLKLEHITGAFMFYAALISLAVGIFLVEVVYWLTHGKKVQINMNEQEKNERRQIVFRAVVDISKDRITTRLTRFRSKRKLRKQSK